MPTRLREFRKRLGLTLQQVAKKAGTTAQTIQRLETGNMTVSVEWLKRIALVFGVEPADLLSTVSSSQVTYLGTLSNRGLVPAEPDDQPPGCLTMTALGLDPVAARLSEQAGPFDIGTILIADRLKTPGTGMIDGRDCLVSLKRGPLLFRRVLWDGEGTVTLIPHESAIGVHRRANIRWIAPIIMAVRYFAEPQPSGE